MCVITAVPAAVPKPPACCNMFLRQNLSHIRKFSEDGGAAHFAKTIKSALLKLACPDTIVEPLIPDFKYDIDSIKKIIESEPEVVSHNKSFETVRRLSPKVRDFRATYEQSLSVLRKIKEINPKIYTKSSIMVGHERGD